MTEISTHVLDLTRGAPAAGVGVELLAAVEGDEWVVLGSSATDQDGRATGLAGSGGAVPGLHKLVFAAGGYQRRLTEVDPFLDEVAVSFTVADESRLHIPLLLSAYGISIYRGS
jgi:5-hydroxyisourate hydrolase